MVRAVSHTNKLGGTVRGARLKLNAKRERSSNMSIQKTMMVCACIALATLATRPADAQVLDYLTGKKPILKVHTPEESEERVEV